MIHWNASPEIVQIGPFALRWYGVLFATSFFLGYRICGNLFKGAGRTLAQLDRLFVAMFIGTLAGARLGHCLFYEPEIYLADPIRIFKIWEGGLASHGAVLGILSALYFYGRREQKLAGKKGTVISPLWALDCVTRGVALASCLIRVGNFFNSEIIGRPSSVPWAVVFERIDRVPRHPAQLYESMTYLVLFGLLTVISKKPRARLGSGVLFGIFLAYAFSARIVLETFKENQVSFENGMILNMGQILSIPAAIAGVFFVVRGLRKSDATQ